MVTIDIVRSHTLDREQACSAVQEMAEQLKHDLGIDYHWEGSVLRFKRRGARGRIRISESDIRVEVTLGVLLAPLKPKIEAEIEGYLRQYTG